MNGSSVDSPRLQSDRTHQQHVSMGVHRIGGHGATRGVHSNGEGSHGEDYWRNRAYQAEHTAAAVRSELFEVMLNSK